MDREEQQSYEEILMRLKNKEEESRNDAHLDEFDQVYQSICQDRVEKCQQRIGELEWGLSTGNPILCSSCGRNPITIGQLIQDPLVSECQVCRSEKLFRPQMEILYKASG